LPGFSIGDKNFKPGTVLDTKGPAEFPADSLTGARRAISSNDTRGPVISTVHVKPKFCGSSPVPNQTQITSALIQNNTFTGRANHMQIISRNDDNENTQEMRYFWDGGIK
jgi:hypothetical protein